MAFLWRKDTKAPVRGVHGLSQSPCRFCLVPQSRGELSPFTAFPNHYSLIIPTSDTRKSELQTVSYKLWIKSFFTYFMFICSQYLKTSTVCMAFIAIMNVGKISIRVLGSSAPKLILHSIAWFIHIMCKVVTGVTWCNHMSHGKPRLMGWHM